MSRAGHIKLSRKIYEDDVFWNEPRVFSRYEAWEDLIQAAAWKRHRRVVGADVVELNRGEVLASERYLAERWSWSRSKVRRFVQLLVTKLERIRPSRETSIGTIYALVNYDAYQSTRPTHRPTNETSSGPARGQLRTTTGPPRNQHGTKGEERKKNRRRTEEAGAVARERERGPAASTAAELRRALQALAAKVGAQPPPAAQVQRWMELLGCGQEWMLAELEDLATRGHLHDKGLGYVWAALRGRWRETNPRAASRVGPEPIDIEQRLQGLAEALPEDLPGRETWVGRIRGLEGEPADVEDSLQLLDAELMDALGECLPADELADIEASARTQFEGAVSRLPGAERQAALRRFERSLLRGRFRLPELSLFNPEVFDA